MNLLSVKGAAEKWNVSERTVSKLCLDGDISAACINNVWIFSNNQHPPIKL